MYETLLETINKLKGGKGDKLSPEDVDSKELEMGIKVELEHTKDREKAKEIALDHLSENPHYYNKLKKSGLADELKEGLRSERQSQISKEEEPLLTQIDEPQLKGLMGSAALGIMSPELMKKLYINSKTAKAKLQIKKLRGT